MASVSVAGSSDRLGRAVAKAVVAGLVVAAALAVLAVVTVDVEQVEGVVTGEVTARPRLVDVAGVAAIAVRVDDEPLVFLPRDARGDPLAWCRATQVRPGRFVSRLWGSEFAADGRKLGGPAPRDLDRYRTHVEDGRLVVETDHVERGAGFPSPPGTSVDWHRGLTLEPGWCPR